MRTANVFGENSMNVCLDLPPTSVIVVLEPHHLVRTHLPTNSTGIQLVGVWRT